MTAEIVLSMMIVEDQDYIQPAWKARMIVSFLVTWLCMLENCDLEDFLIFVTGSSNPATYTVRFLLFCIH